jgi:cell division protein FtsL|tara:strand:- start:333 stop:488 length:156 start_codon:yes stop_codon:yes gene_type:complete
MNTLLYIGLGLFALGAIGFIVSTAMISHYEQKLYEVNQKIKALNKKAERIL